MIATRQKDFEDILEALEDYSSVYIVGCGDCATVLQTGGEYEVAEMAEKLQAQGKEITGQNVPDVTCQVLDTKRLLRQDRDIIEKTDAVLVLACGSGIQAVADSLPETPVVAGLDTTFQADKFRGGQFYEWCSGCGECVVDQFLGVCPVTRCPKGQLNGPCGGCEDGKCEVDPERDCVWALIYERIDALGDPKGVTKDIVEPKDFQKASPPREYVFEPRRG
ncbi:MAG: methylenetetrahydrofolate reductase C-terminal domain-containing protein [Armatimonadota bacterium]